MTMLANLRKEYSELLTRAGALKRDIARMKAEYSEAAQKYRYPPEPEPWMFERFNQLCRECHISEATIRGNSRMPRTIHCRIYIAWKMYTERYEDNDPPSYPNLTTIMREKARSHTQVWQWVRMGRDNPNFQRPPMEGEYAK